MVSCTDHLSGTFRGWSLVSAERGRPLPLNATACILGAPPSRPRAALSLRPHLQTPSPWDRASADGLGAQARRPESPCSFLFLSVGSVGPSREGRRHFMDSVTRIENGPVGPVCSPPTPASQGPGPCRNRHEARRREATVGSVLKPVTSPHPSNHPAMLAGSGGISMPPDEG